MFKLQHFRASILASFIAAALSSQTAFANAEFKVQPSNVYQVVKNQVLADALSQLAQRSGTVFKMNVDISKDVVNTTLVANDWDTAIKALLAGYNYSIIQEAGIRTVIISGHNGNGSAAAPSQVSVPSNKLKVISPIHAALPTKYQQFPAGSVTPVNLPMATLLAMKKGDSAELDLPLGQFQVQYDALVADNSGNQTWIGHLSTEGSGYRMMLSQGAAGLMGHVSTPEGMFNLETEGGASYLIDTRALQTAGYEGDTLASPTTLMNAVVENAALTLTQLQTALDVAKKANDAAQAGVKTATDSNNKNIAALTEANNKLSAAVNIYNNAVKAYNAALQVYYKSQSAANKAALNQAINSANASITSYNTSLKAYQVALAAKNTSSTLLAQKVAAAVKTQAAYDAAVKALAAAQQPKPTPSPTPTTTPSVSPTPAPASAGGTSKSVVDLMVLYTTANVKADYTKQRLAYLVAASNQAYIDSGIDMTLRLVYAEPTTYTDNNSNSQALTDLASDAGVFAGVAKKREHYGADLVFLFRPLFMKTAGSCGTTYLEAPNGSALNKWLGFGTINDGNAVDQAGYYCAVNTFTHEIGHSLGLVHDRENSNSQGAFSYSYAWGIQGKFGTIMSYKSPVVMLFSTPKLATQCAGTPCGFAESNATQSSDQSKSVNLLVPKIASFMPTMVTDPTIK